MSVINISISPEIFGECSSRFSENELNAIKYVLDSYTRSTIEEIYEILKSLGFKRSQVALVSQLAFRSEFFGNWRKRLTKEEKAQADKSSRKVPSNLSTITAKKREEVVKYAIFHSIREASKKYNIAYNTIYTWSKRYDGSISSLEFDSQGLIQSESEINILKKVIKDFPNLPKTKQFKIAKDRGYIRSFSTFKQTVSSIGGKI